MLNLDHKRLEVWQTSVELAVAVYELTESYPKSEMYGLTSQLRRASVSVPSNIAEGPPAVRLESAGGSTRSPDRPLWRWIQNLSYPRSWGTARMGI